MKRKALSFVLIAMLVTIPFAACAPSTENTPSVDEQVQTAVAATATAEAEKNAAINQAVAATVTAMPTMTPYPTPTPLSEEEYYEVSEEELAAMIDEAVNEAVAATESTAAATSSAASDGTMSSEEVYDTAAYVYDAEDAIYYAEELIEIYYDMYGSYADDAVLLLQETEELLNTMNQSLEEMDEILVQGAEAASAAIDNLDEHTDALQEQISETRETREDFMEEFRDALDEREAIFSEINPTEVAPDLNETIEQLHDYVDTVKASLADRKIDREEMNRIAQLGANAKASLQANGGPKLQGLGASIDGITSQLARGEWSKAQTSLGGFEASIPERPGRH